MAALNRVRQSSIRGIPGLERNGARRAAFSNAARRGISALNTGMRSHSCSEIPACRGPAVLFILIEVDPITGKISEEYPDAYPKDYPERAAKFCRNLIWRKLTGDITVEFLEAAVDRMFSADEVTRVVDLARLKRLKHQIVSLFLER
jgi:hypothetical protein